MSDIKQSDIFETVDKYLKPAEDKPKLAQLLRMLPTRPTPAGKQPAGPGPVAPGVENPALLRGKYDEAINQMVKPEPINPDLFKFQGGA